MLVKFLLLDLPHGLLVEGNLGRSVDTNCGIFSVLIILLQDGDLSKILDKVGIVTAMTVLFLDSLGLLSELELVDNFNLLLSNFTIAIVAIIVVTIIRLDLVHVLLQAHDLIELVIGSSLIFLGLLSLLLSVGQLLFFLDLLLLEALRLNSLLHAEFTTLESLTIELVHGEAHERLRNELHVGDSLAKMGLGVANNAHIQDAVTD